MPHEIVSFDEPKLREYLGELGAPSRSLNQTSKSSHSSLSPMGSLKEPCQHACLKHPSRALGPKPFLSENPTVQRPRLQGDADVLPTISSEEPNY
jgi:hypothetical protein